MNAPATGQIRLVIVGATGMVGGYALRYALDHPSIGTVTVIGRRKLGISRPKLKEILHRDFADCSALTQPLSGQDGAVSGYRASEQRNGSALFPGNDGRDSICLEGSIRALYPMRSSARRAGSSSRPLFGGTPR